jgi:hypothetical protein
MILDRNACIEVSYLNMFAYGSKVVDDPVLSKNIVPVIPVRNRRSQWNPGPVLIY